MSLQHPLRKLHPDDRVVGNLALRFGFAALAVAGIAALVILGAASPQTLTRPAIGPVPLSLVLAAALILFAVALTGLYVLLANRSAGR